MPATDDDHRDRAHQDTTRRDGVPPDDNGLDRVPPDDNRRRGRRPDDSRGLPLRGIAAVILAASTLVGALAVFTEQGRELAAAIRGDSAAPVSPAGATSTAAAGTPAAGTPAGEPTGATAGGKAADGASGGGLEPGTGAADGQGGGVPAGGALAGGVRSGDAAGGFGAGQAGTDHGGTGLDGTGQGGDGTGRGGTGQGGDGTGRGGSGGLGGSGGSARGGSGGSAQGGAGGSVNVTLPPSGQFRPGQFGRGRWSGGRRSDGHGLGTASITQVVPADGRPGFGGLADVTVRVDSRPEDGRSLWLVAHLHDVGSPPRHLYYPKVALPPRRGTYTYRLQFGPTAADDPAMVGTRRTLMVVSADQEAARLLQTGANHDGDPAHDPYRLELPAGGRTLVSNREDVVRTR